MSVVIFRSLHSANFRGKAKSEDDYLTAGTRFIPNPRAFWLHRGRIVIAYPGSRHSM